VTRHSFSLDPFFSTKLFYLWTINSMSMEFPFNLSLTMALVSETIDHEEHLRITETLDNISQVIFYWAEREDWSKI
jgi:hypothetical protein